LAEDAGAAPFDEPAGVDEAGDVLDVEMAEEFTQAVVVFAESGGNDCGRVGGPHEPVASTSQSGLVPMEPSVVCSTQQVSDSMVNGDPSFSPMTSACWNSATCWVTSSKP
jgi:hypothetical protein